MHRLLLVALASCGRVGFDASSLSGGGNDDGGGGAGDANGDATSDSSGSGAAVCMPPAVSCAFDGATPCSCWGTPSTIFATMTEGSGALTITPNANQAGAQGACTRTNVPFDARGLFVEVSSVVSGAQGLTALQIGSSPDVFEIDIQGTTMVTTDGSNMGSRTYEPAFMRWWWIHPTATGTVFETSVDGKSWTPFYTSGRIASATYTVRLIGGTIGGVAAPGFARFEGVNVCPP